MADMTRIKGRIAETIYPNGQGAITAESHQALLLEMVDDINAKKADKEEVTTVAESVSILSQEVESNRINLTESLDALEQKVDNLPQGGGDVKADGVYPDLTAGDLAGRGESVHAEFGFRASGGKSIKDGRAYIKRIKGNSVVWNQWVDTIATQDCDLSETDNRLTLTPQGGFPGVTNAISMNIVENHVYICISHRIGGGFLNVNCGGQDVATNVPFRAEQGHYGFVVYSYNETQPFTITRPILIDLTKMFGEGYEPTTIDEYEARKPIVADEYAYNEGQVIHCNTESIKSVGDNAWDEQWEGGSYDLTTGEPTADSAYIRTKHFIDVLPNERYYIKAANVGRLIYYDQDHTFISVSESFGGNWEITTPNNCRYMRYRWEGSAYNNDIMITLVHSGWKQDTDAGYQPYWEDTLPLPIIRKYFPQGMKKWDKIIKKDGKWYAVNASTIARIGDLTCSRFSEGIFSLSNLPKIAAVDSRGYSVNVISANFIPAFGAYGNLMKENTVCIVDDFLWLSGENLVQYETAEDLLTSLADVVVYYELAEPIVTELDAEDQNFRDYYNVADFGTEQSQSEVPSAPFSADIIYQFNAVDMIREHELEITELQKVIATMQAQMASLIAKS